MKLVKIFGFVLAVHAAVFMFIFAIPGCRTTGKKAATSAPAIGEADTNPVGGVEGDSPIAPVAGTADLPAIRFSPTRPGTPVAAEVTTKVATTAASSYTVVKGDNLWSIAKKNNTSVKELTAANNLRSDTPLKLGQKLIIPGKVVTSVSAPTTAIQPKATSTAPAAPASSSTVVHVVKSGETLGGIAKKYSVRVGDIATANNIADPTKIRVGQSLKVPGASAPAASSPAPVAKPVATVAPAKPAAPVEPAPAPSPAPSPAPLFVSPFVESAPAPSGDSPFVAPATPTTDAPIIRVEESGAPRIE